MRLRKVVMYFVLLILSIGVGTSMAVPEIGFVKWYPKGVQLSYTCLQGIVNRSGQLIYLDDNDAANTQEHKDKEWYEIVVGGTYDLNVTNKLSDSFDAVCWDYQNYIAGYTIFNPGTDWECNAAITLAGAIDYVPVTPEWAVHLQALGLMTANNTLDIRNQWSSAQQCYEHMYNYHWAQCTAPFVAVHNPNDPDGPINAIDYYVYSRAFVFYFQNDPDLPAIGTYPYSPISGSFINQCYSDKMYVMGWAWPEGTDSSVMGNVNYASQNDAWTVPCSPWGPRNLSLLSQYTAQATAQTQGNAITAKKKYYVAFMVSDGDNASMLSTHFKERWDDPARGQVPIGWGMSPWFSKYIGPCYLKWFMENKSANDYIASSVSGTGYSYLMEHSYGFRQAYLAQTASDMSTFGMEVGWVLNDTENPINNQVLGEYIDATGVKAVFVNFGGDGNYYVWHDAMVINSIDTYTNDETVVLNKIQARAAQLGKPGFIMVNCNGWGMTPTKIKWVADQLGSQYKVLRPDVFAKTYLKIYGYPY